MCEIPRKKACMATRESSPMEMDDPESKIKAIRITR
jgi:hypothetical protein